MLKRHADIRVALIGCGAISELFYSPAFLSLAPQHNISMCALVDPNPDRLSILGRAFPSAKKITNLKLLDCSAIDLVVIASPQRYHAEQAVDLLHQGVHVLCEKPLASNLVEAETMVKVAQHNKRLLAVGLFRRFWPIHQYVKDLIIGQDLGRAIGFHWSEGGVFDWPAATPSFFRRENSPGGVFADLGAHILDLLLNWFGPVSGFDYQDDAMGGLEANAVVDLRFANGVSGQVRLSRDTPIPNTASIEFERGILFLQPGSVSEVTLVLKHSQLVAKASLFNNGPGPVPSLSLCHQTHTYTQCFMEQIRNMCSAIRGQEQLRVPGSEALLSMALLDQCYASRKLMVMPWLTSAQRACAEALAT